MKSSYKLVFETEEGKNVIITISGAKLVSQNNVNTAMDRLIASGAIKTKYGKIIAKKKGTLEKVTATEFAVNA